MSLRRLYLLPARGLSVTPTPTPTRSFTTRSRNPTSSNATKTKSNKDEGEDAFRYSTLFGGPSDSGTKWVMTEDSESLCYEGKMPAGVVKGDLMVALEGRNLGIKNLKEGGKKYMCSALLNPNVYDLGGIKAKMNSGALKITIPKLSQADKRKEVVRVPLD